MDEHFPWGTLCRGALRTSEPTAPAGDRNVMGIPPFVLAVYLGISLCANSTAVLGQVNPDDVATFYQAGASLILQNRSAPTDPTFSIASVFVENPFTESIDGTTVSDGFDVSSVFTAPLPAGGTGSINLAARVSSQVEPGFVFRSDLSVEITNGFLNSAAPFVNPDSTTNPTGVPNSFQVSAGGVIKETLTVAGDPSLASIVLELDVEGEWAEQPDDLDIVGSTSSNSITQGSGAAARSIYVRTSSGTVTTINDRVVSDPVPVVGGQAEVVFGLAQAATVRLAQITGAIPASVSVTGSFSDTIRVSIVRGIDSSGNPVALRSVATSNGAAIPVANSEPVEAEPVPIPAWALGMLVVILGSLGRMAMARSLRAG